MGLTWDEGPDDLDAAYGPYRQSDHSQLYPRVADNLLKEGKTYHCFCIKEELEAMKEKKENESVPPRYNSTWRDADPVKERNSLFVSRLLDLLIVVVASFFGLVSTNKHVFKCYKQCIITCVEK